MVGIPISTLNEFINTTLPLIDDVLEISFKYDDPNSLREVSFGFSRNERSHLRGFFGSLDVLPIKIIDHSINYVPNPSVYYNRKGCFALNFLALFDHKLRFLFVSLFTPIPSHYFVVVQLSGLFDILKDEDDRKLDDY